jgi:hypothetical protein
VIDARLANEEKPGTRKVIMVHHCGSSGVTSADGNIYWCMDKQGRQMADLLREGEVVVLEATNRRDYTDDQLWKIVEEDVWKLAKNE